MTVCRENVRIDGIKSPATNHGESSLHARVNKMLNISEAIAEMETIFFFTQVYQHQSTHQALGEFF